MFVLGWLLNIVKLITQGYGDRNYSITCWDFKNGIVENQASFDGNAGQKFQGASSNYQKRFRSS